MKLIAIILCILFLISCTPKWNIPVTVKKEVKSIEEKD